MPEEDNDEIPSHLKNYSSDFIGRLQSTERDIRRVMRDLQKMDYVVGDHKKAMDAITEKMKEIDERLVLLIKMAWGAEEQRKTIMDALADQKPTIDHFEQELRSAKILDAYRKKRKAKWAGIWATIGAVGAFIGYMNDVWGSLLRFLTGK